MNHLMWKVGAQSGPFAPGLDHPGVSPSAVPLDDATHVIWQDPSAYNPFFHGPPYLPGMQVRIDKSASNKESPTSLAMRMASDRGHGLPSILALLRSLVVIHQTHHWLTSGEAYYSDHLLFERLYNETVVEVDAVAEKSVGTGSPTQLLHPGLQAKAVASIVAKFCGDGVSDSLGGGPDFYVGASFHAEAYFLTCVKWIVENMRGFGELTRGTDNLLAGIEDKHEGHLYLLQQRSTKTSSGESP